MESEVIRAWEFGRFSENVSEIDDLLKFVFEDNLDELARIKNIVENRSYDDELEDLIGDIYD